MSTSHGGRRQGSAYVAVNSFVVGVAGVASGVIGGAIAQTLRGWHATVFGWPLTYHSVLFLLTLVMRLVAVGWAFRLEDPRAHGPRATLRYLATDIYSNAQQVVLAPVRLLARVGRWTYRLNQPRKH
jgi:MFS family permease